MKKILQQVPLFVFLLPLFFIMHGLLENYGFIEIRDCLWLLAKYSLATGVIFLIFYLIFKTPAKAALLTAYLFSFNFFFSVLHDLLKKNLEYLSRYSVSLPLFGLFFLLLMIWMKRTASTFCRVTLFLNILILVWIFIDGSALVVQFFRPPSSRLSITKPPDEGMAGSLKNGNRPDIYFLLFDEYASTPSLKQWYNYDNSGLDSFLQQQGFHIQSGSLSNYNITPFSMASILNMSYLHGIKDPLACTLFDYAYCGSLIRNNEVNKFLSYRNYEVVNYSQFDLAKHPSIVDQTLLPIRANLITARTFLARFRKDIEWNFYTGTFLFGWFSGEGGPYTSLENDKKLLQRVQTESTLHNRSPRFIYGHFEMPHPPFYFDKQGRPVEIASLSVSDENQDGIQPYLDYIPYTNSRLKELITAIRNNSHDSAVIILMGDHGFRPDIPDEHHIHHFQNLNAVYFPTKDYANLPDSITGVNMFRVVFNKLFHQNFPLLKDSLIYLRDMK